MKILKYVMFLMGIALIVSGCADDNSSQLTSPDGDLQIDVWLNDN
ncbi:hypothetical protein [Rhodohalobacter sp. SW132]|nr:hypothetical protein [Rhodohalobacter sp. SW132]